MVSAEDQSHPSPLATKFASPQLPLTLVQRARLFADLDAGSNHRLVLLSASAGSGKSTLLAAWAVRAREQGKALAWLSLDTLDNDPARFWAMLIAALRTCLLSVGETAARLLHHPQPAPIMVVLTSLINELVETDSEIILVLDDYHAIEDQAIHEGMTFLLDHLPAKLRLILASRIDPDLPLARWRTRGQMLEIRDSDLQFTSGEASHFLTRMLGTSLPAEEVNLLHQRTEGWIAGIQLATLALRRREDHAAFLQAFTGSHRYLMDYVQQEILKHLPEPLHQFLLQIAVLPRMNADLCQAVTGESASQEFLETLERNNLFLIPLDEERRWYRLHDLFREVLLARLQATQPEQVPVLRQRAASFHEARGEMREAVAYVLAARDFSYAASLMEQSVEEIWLRGETQTLYRWMSALPDVVLRAHARLALTASLYLLNSSSSTVEAQQMRARTQVEHILARVEAALQDPTENMLPESETLLLQRRLRLMSLWIESYDAIAEGDVQRLSHLSHAMQQLEPDNDMLWQMIPLSNLFILHVTFQGTGGILVPRLQEAKRRVSQTRNYYATIKISQWLALAAFQAGQLHLVYQECLGTQTLLQHIEGHPILAGYIFLCLADVLYEWNQLAESDTLSQKIIQEATAWQQIDLYKQGYFLVTQSALAAGDLSRAHLALQKLEDSTRQHELRDHYAPWIAAFRARYWLVTGDLAAASAWASQVVFHTENWNPDRREEFLMLVRVYCAQQQYNRAIEMLEQFSAYLDRPGDGILTVYFLALSFMALHHAGRGTQARRVVARLFMLTEPEGFLRVYLDHGEPMRQALQALLAAPPADAGFSRSYVSTLLAAFEQEEQRRAQRAATLSPDSQETSPQPQPGVSSPVQSALIEPLSPQERRVLRLLVAGRSNPEIASELIVSVNTVKTQVQHIYRKLGVSNRLAASVAARDLRLL